VRQFGSAIQSTTKWNSFKEGTNNSPLSKNPRPFFPIFRCSILKMQDSGLSWPVRIPDVTTLIAAWWLVEQWAYWMPHLVVADSKRQLQQCRYWVTIRRGHNSQGSAFPGVTLFCKTEPQRTCTTKDHVAVKDKCQKCNTADYHPYANMYYVSLGMMSLSVHVTDK